MKQILMEGLVMDKAVQVKFEVYDDNAYIEQEAGAVKFTTGNRDLSSEFFSSEIDAWARQASAANGFTDY